MGATTQPYRKVKAGAPRMGVFRSEGDVENLLHAFQHRSADVRMGKQRNYYYPGHSARALMDGALVAQFGQLHPEIAATRKLARAFSLREIYLRSSISPGTARGFVISPAAVSGPWNEIFPLSLTMESRSRKIQHSVTGLGLSELRSFVPVEISAEAKSLRANIRCFCGPVFSRPTARCGKMKRQRGRRKSSRRWKGWAEAARDRPSGKPRVRLQKNYPVSSCESEFQPSTLLACVFASG